MTDTTSIDRFDRYLLSVLIAGINLQQGQSLLIMANRQDNVIVDRLCELALSCQAKTCERLYYQDYESTPIQSLLDKATTGWAFLKLNIFERFVGENNQGAKMAAFSAYLKPLSVYSQSGKIQSCSSVIPSASWSTSVFPHLGEEAAIERMKEELVDLGYCDHDDYLIQIKSHVEKLGTLVQRLNKMRLKTLAMKSATCDLTIGLHDQSIWVGGPQFAQGIAYLPNYPTQEVFTVNAKHLINGWFNITRSFRFGDQLIRDLKVEVRHGRVVDLESSQNIKAFMDHIFAQTDRQYFGEIALVPKVNPIAQQHRLYDCVLLDENAVSHIALGYAYPVCSQNHEYKVKNDEVNTSDIHLDLMFGSEDLVVTAYDGICWTDLCI